MHCIIDELSVFVFEHHAKEDSQSQLQQPHCQRHATVRVCSVCQQRVLCALQRHGYVGCSACDDDAVAADAESVANAECDSFPSQASLVADRDECAEEAEEDKVEDKERSHHDDESVDKDVLGARGQDADERGEGRKIYQA